MAARRQPRIATTICTRRRSCRSSADIAGAAKALVKKSYLYTNNHFAAKSVVNAVMLKAQLGEPIEGEYPPELIERYPELEGSRVRYFAAPASRLPV